MIMMRSYGGYSTVTYLTVHSLPALFLELKSTPQRIKPDLVSLVLHKFPSIAIADKNPTDRIADKLTGDGPVSKNIQRQYIQNNKKGPSLLYRYRTIIDRKNKGRERTQILNCLLD